MEKLRGTGLILIGVVLAVLSAARAAPDLVQAFSEPALYQLLDRQVSGGGRGEQIYLPSPIQGPVPLTARRKDQFQPDSLSPSPSFLAEEDGAVLLIPPGVQASPEVEEELPNLKPNPPTVERTAHIRAGEVPNRLWIESIRLDAPIVPAQTSYVQMAGKVFQQWLAPDQFAAGWHSDSALLGLPGNTVLNGHNNAYGEIFRTLDQVQTGEVIEVYSANHRFTYRVTNRMILPEKYEQLDTRMENARWILPSQDERLTLITCWPYESNTHRLILVAVPEGEPVVLASSSVQGE